MSAGPGKTEPLKRRLASGGLVGGILRLPNEALVEVAGLVGFDFLVLDCEHGPADDTEVARHLALADAVGLDVLVRVGAIDPAAVQRILDLGATGIVVPHVATVTEARAAVEAAHYPPLGSRGLAVYTRAGRYGLSDPVEHVARAGERTMVVVMVEDAAGVSAAPEVLGVDGVDAVLAGPSDLSLDLGLLGHPGHADVRGAIASVHVAARERGRAVLAITGDVDAAARAESDVSVVYNLQAMQTALLREARRVR